MAALRGKRSEAEPEFQAGRPRPERADIEILYLTEEGKNYVLRALTNTTINTTIKI